MRMAAIPSFGGEFRIDEAYRLCCDLFEKIVNKYFQTMLLIKLLGFV